MGVAKTSADEPKPTDDDGGSTSAEATMREAIAYLPGQLALRPDAEQARLRLGTAFIEHVDDLWPLGEPAATPEWIRANVDDILAALEKAFAIGRYGRPSSLLRVPQRLHWLLWLLADIDQGASRLGA